MDKPQDDIQGVLEVLLSTDSKKVEQCANNVYVQDAVMESPFFVWRGKGRIAKVWSTWSYLNWRIETVQVLDACFDAAHNRLYVDLRYSFQPLVYPFMQTGTGLVVMDLVRQAAPGGKGREAWYIQRHEDLIQPDTLFASLLPEPLGSALATLYMALQYLVGVVVTYGVYHIGVLVNTVMKWTAIVRTGPSRPTFQGPIRTPEADLVPLMQSLLCTDSDHVKAVVNQNFSPDAAYDHPFVRLIGREEIRRLYTTWSRLQWSITDHTITASHSAATHRSYLDVSYKLQPLIFTSTVEVRVVTVLHLEPTKTDGSGSTHKDSTTATQPLATAITPAASTTTTTHPVPTTSYLIKHEIDYVQPSTVFSLAMPGFRWRTLSFVLRVLQVVVGMLIVYVGFPFISIVCSIVKTAAGQ